MKYDKLIIYSDGGARGNPGPAGIGVVVYHGKDKIEEHSRFLGLRRLTFDVGCSMFNAVSPPTPRLEAPAHLHGAP